MPGAGVKRGRGRACPAAANAATRRATRAARGEPAAWRSCSTARTRTPRPGAGPCCAALPGLDFRVWPEVGDPAEIDAALVWRAPPGLLRALPEPAAGPVAGGRASTRMLADPTLPDLPLCRLVDPSLTRHDGRVRAAPGAQVSPPAGPCSRAQQRRARWQLRAAAAARGHGRRRHGPGRARGRRRRASCAAHGFTVRGWSRTPKAARRGRAASPARASWPRSWPAPTSWSACCR